MNGFDLAQIAVLAFFSGLGSATATELTKYLIKRAKNHDVVKKLTKE